MTRPWRRSSPLGSTPPLAGYDTTVLYALGHTMVPHAYRWKAEGAVPSTKPTGYDVPHPKKKKSEVAKAN